jgi:hypothetical protein
MEQRKQRKRQRNTAEDSGTQLACNGACQSSHNCVAEWFPCVSSSITRVSDSLVFKMARKVDEASNLVFVQLIEQEPGIYDKSHPDYARQDKTDLAWERISHETKESGMYVCIYL